MNVFLSSSVGKLFANPFHDSIALGGFVAENYEQRISLYKIMKGLYGKRSHIVHGNIKGSNRREKGICGQGF